MGKNSLRPVGIAAVRIGHKGTVLLSDKETGGHGVHTESIAELDGQLSCKVFGKIHYGCLGRSVSDNAGKGSESRFRCHIDDGPSTCRKHGLSKDHRRYHRPEKVKVHHLAEIFDTDVEDCLVRRYRSPRHISSGTVHKDIHFPVCGKHIGAVLLENVPVRHIGLKEHGFVPLRPDSGGKRVAFFFIACKNRHFGTL